MVQCIDLEGLDLYPVAEGRMGTQCGKFKKAGEKVAFQNTLEKDIIHLLLLLMM